MCVAELMSDVDGDTATATATAVKAVTVVIDDDNDKILCYLVALTSGGRLMYIVHIVTMQMITCELHINIHCTILYTVDDMR